MLCSLIEQYIKRKKENSNEYDIIQQNTILLNIKKGEGARQENMCRRRKRNSESTIIDSLTKHACKDK